MMRKLKLIVLSIFLLPSICIAQNLDDLLNNPAESFDLGTAVGGVVEGIFTKSKLTLRDLVGDYVSEGPAVTFKSENFLKKAGGMAGAATLESKLKPYYEQYGLTGLTLNIAEDAKFSMKIKGLPLSGEVTKNEGDGTFDFNLTVLGMRVGKFKTYVEKTGSTLKVMFDATKLKDMISSVAKLTGNSMATTLSDILDSYEGACVGFRMKSTGSASSTPTETGNSEKVDSTSQDSSTGLEGLRDILNKQR